MERLTKRINGYAHGAEGIGEDSLTGNYCRGEFEATACVERLAEYEDLEEQGKLLKAPYTEKGIGNALICNCDGCINNNTNECMHCMRAYTDCYKA